MSNGERNEENRKGIPAGEAEEKKKQGRAAAENASEDEFEAWIKRIDGTLFLIHLLATVLKEAGDEIAPVKKAQLEALLRLFREALKRRDGAAAYALSQALVQAAAGVFSHGHTYRLKRLEEDAKRTEDEHDD